FLITGYCGMPHAWPDRRRLIEGSRLLAWREIKVMAEAGMCFGSHTRTHRDLTRVGALEAEREMVDSNPQIEDAPGPPLQALAYPFGALDPRVRDRARAHFVLACATTLDFVRVGSDPFALERLDMYYFQRPDALRRLFSLQTRAYVRFRRGLRACRRVCSGA